MDAASPPKTTSRPLPLRPRSLPTHSNAVSPLFGTGLDQKNGPHDSLSGAKLSNAPSFSLQVPPRSDSSRNLRRRSSPLPTISRPPRHDPPSAAHIFGDPVIRPPSTPPPILLSSSGPTTLDVPLRSSGEIPFLRSSGEQLINSYSDEDLDRRHVLFASGSGDIGLPVYPNTVSEMRSHPELRHRSPRAQRLARKPKVSTHRTRWTVLETQPGLLSKNTAFLPDPTPCTILAVVPFFNEAPEDLFRTLRDIYINQQTIRHKAIVNDVARASEAVPIIHVMMVMDGYNKADQRTIEWCRRMFHGDPWEVLEHLSPDKKESTEVVRWFQNQVKKDPDNFDDVWQLKLRGITSTPGAFDADGKHYPRRGIIQGIPHRQAIADPLKEYAVIFQNANDIRTMDTLGLTKITRPRPPLESKTYFSGVMQHTTCYCNPCDRCEPLNEDLEEFELPLTLLVKCRNRQKHDSHWWSLCPNGFIYTYSDARYVFFTDCGTLFHKDCIYEMVKEMEANPSNGAVTGRQRVMSAKQQGCEGEGWVSEFLRHVQRCDFELGFATSVGAFAAAGCLPVLPGPCGLYRLDVIMCGAGEFYHSFLEMDPDEIGVIEGNVMIAEDRILSISPFFSQQPKHWKDKSEPIFDLKNLEGVQTMVAPEATFYYEAENNLTSFIKQRRRWVNGTIAGYLWLLFKKPGLVMKFNISLWRRLLLYYLFFIQAYSYLFTFLSPAIFLIIFRYAVRELRFQESLYSEWWFLIFLILYVLFVALSAERRAQAWMFYMGALIGVVVEVMAITGIAYSAVNQALMKNTTDFFLEQGGKIVNGKVVPPPYFIQNFSYFDLAPLGLLVLSALIPMLAALIVSPLSFLYILRSGVQFLLFLPTLVAVFGAYAISNFSDFSWGNRDSTGSADKIGPRLTTLVERGKFFGYFFLALNFTLIFLSLDLFTIPWWRMIAAGFLFGPPLTSIIISCIYWIWWRIAKWCCRDGCRKILFRKINLKSLDEDEKRPICEIQRMLHAKDV